MVIIVLAYLLILWLIFFRLRLLPFNWPWRIVSLVIGLGIVAVFLALLNSLTPSGRVVVLGRVVEVTPDVAGRVTSISAQPNTLVKAGDVLFEIERTTYANKVRQLHAALAEARQKVEQLKSNVDLAGADAQAVASQLAYAMKKRDAEVQLVQANSTAKITAEAAIAQVDMYTPQLVAARARETSAKLALGSVVDGENTSVAQIVAQLDQAQWELDQTTIHAPSDGYVTSMALAIGSRAVPLRAAMSFIVAGDPSIVGFFPQSGFARIKPGARVELSFVNQPGRVYETTIAEVVSGVGEGQIAVAGNLARVSQIGVTADYPALIAPPPGLDPGFVRLGMAGSATVISKEAGPIGTLAIILQWVRAYAMYLS